jgi:SAM-dependent MidA family methyltransferase
MNSGAPIPFERFMEQALYDPRRGYYSRRITGVGRSGDFTTAPMLSEKPARAIASWATQALRETQCRDLIEIGPGEGKLAAAVLHQLPWSIRLRLRFHLVETSTPLEEIQRKRLGSRVKWHPDVLSALQACQGRAVIFSNELVDAYPVRRFQKTALGWQEIAVSFDENRIAHESLMPLAPLPESSVFQESHPLGQNVEVHDSYHRELKRWLPSWRAGRMLTIDYGASAEQLYHRRRAGTLRAYLLQQRLEGAAIYQNPGRQDLTADVNFTDLQAWSAPWLTEQKLCSFRQFIQEFSPDHSTCALTAPAGAGEAFLVLDQHVGESNHKTSRPIRSGS